MSPEQHAHGRSLEVAPRTYAAGAHGPFRVSGFTRDDTDWLALALSVEAWPVEEGLIVCELRWDLGGGKSFTVNSPPRDRHGRPVGSVKMRIPVPRIDGRKAAVRGGTVRFRASSAFRAALVVVAGSDTASTVTP